MFDVAPGRERVDGVIRDMLAQGLHLVSRVGRTPPFVAGWAVTLSGTDGVLVMSPAQLVYDGSRCDRTSGNRPPWRWAAGVSCSSGWVYDSPKAWPTSAMACVGSVTRAAPGCSLADRWAYGSLADQRGRQHWTASASECGVTVRRRLAAGSPGPG
jgi:hypothetical protein